ncbi:Mak10 subunit, NatC N-terminal acetyltransferase-domain-containing protein [Fennellomyces sp. T-0311]|nr:Mak10 subunit, NatC N-terminal acetyltransferase-domain-containing protein [Fennellomyces sp. T-0311]
MQLKSQQYGQLNSKNVRLCGVFETVEVKFLQKKRGFMDSVADSLREAISGIDINDPTGSNGNFLAPAWKDITTFLDDATNDFEVGQLVHLQSFDLFAAMSAIEIMDPKMDTGMLIEDNNIQPLDVDRALEPLELLWIMDRLLSCEMGWISGHSLSQTVYTCIYFHNLQTLVSEQGETSPTGTIRNALKAYILGTVKCCQYVWDEMTLGNVYEEEDFTTNLFGLSLSEHYTDSMVMNAIDTALIEIRNMVERGNPEGSSIFTAEALAPLYNRLLMRKSYLLGLLYLSQPRCSHFVDAKTQFGKVLELLDIKEDPAAISTTIGKGKEVEGAFDPNINRKLTSQAPPRPIALRSDEESYKDYKELVERLLSICDVTNYSSIGSLFNYFKSFGGTQPYPDAFSRSKLNTLFYHDFRVFGKESAVNIVSLAIDELVKPPKWILFPSSMRAPSNIPSAELEHARHSLGEFLKRASAPYIDYFKIQCHNRSRQRRILCKVLQEWEALQEEAEAIDVTFQNLAHIDSSPYHFSCWAYNIKLEMMETILLLGFELELYGNHEYLMIYTYLVYIYQARGYLLERIQYEVEQQKLDPNEKGKSTQQDTTPLDHASQCLKSQRYLSQAQYLITNAIIKILVVVQDKTHQLDILKPRFDDEATRFRQRFKAFSTLSSPAQPTIQVLEEARASYEALETSDLLKAAQKDMQSAKVLLEQLLSFPIDHTRSEKCRESFEQELLGLKRTCVGNIITIVRLSDKKNLVKKVDVTFRYHPSWPVIELKN